MKAENIQGEDDLLARMRAGDEEAFAAIYQRYQGGIYRFALHMTGNTGMAEDVTQEAFIALMTCSAQFDPSQGSLRAFLFGIARNHVLRALTRERGYVALSEDSVEENPQMLLGGSIAALQDTLEDLTRQEVIERVRQAVMTLPPLYREMVVLCDLEEMSYAESAQLLSCSVGTVRSRLHRGRALLLVKLQALGQALPNQKC